jgi:hypothetical protein
MSSSFCNTQFWKNQDFQGSAGITIERAAQNEGGASTCQGEISWWNGQKAGLVCDFRTLRAQPVDATPAYQLIRQFGSMQHRPEVQSADVSVGSEKSGIPHSGNSGTPRDGQKS